MVLGGAWVLLAVCWWGASSLWGWAWGLCCCGRTGALSGSRPTPVAPRWGVLPPPASVGGRGPPLGCCRLLFWGGVLGSALPPGPGRVLGLWWLWWVVCDLYSGCEHLCCLRASPFLFCPAFAVGRVGGRVARGPGSPSLLGAGRVGVFFVVCGFVGHSVDALAPRADEGRCGLRYAPGSWRASFDPGVSEWGNPARVVLGHHHLNVYRVVGGTRGSETSQYP